MHASNKYTTCDANPDASRCVDLRVVTYDLMLTITKKLRDSKYYVIQSCMVFMELYTNKRTINNKMNKGKRF